MHDIDRGQESEGLQEGFFPMEGEERYVLDKLLKDQVLKFCPRFCFNRA